MDVLATPGDQLVGLLASNFEVLKPWLPTGPDPDFMGARYREAADGVAKKFVARAVMFFAARENSFITGQVLYVCGGTSLVGLGPS